MASRARKNRPTVRKKRSFAAVLGALAIVGVVVASLASVANSMLMSWFEDLPDYHNANAFNTSLPTIVYANDGQTELARFQLEYRDPVEYDDICQTMLDAIVAVEDARFYEHSGVDVPGVIRAIINNLAGGRIEGASTITQQFVRNTILAGEMGDITVKRKVREAFIATELEKMYSKNDILVMYLNTINFGAGAYGVEAAAQRYFSKHASELSLTEAALIAGIPQSPTYNDPLLYPDRALARRNAVLDRMHVNHYITYEECLAAQAQPIVLNPKVLQDDGILAYPYFTSYVRYLLYNNYDLSEAEILKGGLKVYTTLDVAKQNAAEWAASVKRDSLNDSMEVAVAVVEPSTGYVQAIVGGHDYGVSQVNLATGQGGYGRPCGSVFKTFTLVTAIKKGINPWTTYVDCTSPATVDGYTLENYANGNYGTRTIAGAFAVSSNTGFVRVCASVGVGEVAQTAYDLGIESNLYEEQAYLPLTLGVQNITPLETANAFATIANGGIHHDLCAITTILSRDGKVLVDDTDPEPRAKRVISEEVAHAALIVMEGVINGGTGTGAGLYSGQPVAGKTGTSEDYKDITFAGCTPQLSMAIWIGDPTNVASVPTGTAADVFHNYASEVLADSPVVDFTWAEDPPYETYNDRDHHVTSTYEDWRSDEDKAAEKAEEYISTWKPGKLKEKDLEDLYEHLTVRVTYEYSDKYEEGIVIDQSINTRNHTVYVTVSKGLSPEDKKKEEDAKQEEARKAEEAAKKEQEAKQAEEAKRAAEEAKKAEEARKAAEEAKKAEEARKAAEEAAKAAEEARKAAEEAAKQQQQQQQQQSGNAASSGSAKSG